MLVGFLCISKDCTILKVYIRFQAITVVICFTGPVFLSSRTKEDRSRSRSFNFGPKNRTGPDLQTLQITHHQWQAHPVDGHVQGHMPQMWRSRTLLLCLSYSWLRCHCQRRCCWWWRSHFHCCCQRRNGLVITGNYLFSCIFIPSFSFPSPLFPLSIYIFHCYASQLEEEYRNIQAVPLLSRFFCIWIICSMY